MFERLRRTLVETFVGAIALGYLLAQGILHFVNIFTSPVTGWVTRNEYREMMPRTASSEGLPLRLALPELIRFFLLLVVWYLLVRWLYFRPFKDSSEPAKNPELPFLRDSKE